MEKEQNDVLRVIASLRATGECDRTDISRILKTTNLYYHSYRTVQLHDLLRLWNKTSLKINRPLNFDLGRLTVPWPAFADVHETPSAIAISDSVADEVSRFGARLDYLVQHATDQDIRRLCFMLYDNPDVPRQSLTIIKSTPASLAKYVDACMPTNEFVYTKLVMFTSRPNLTNFKRHVDRICAANKRLKDHFRQKSCTAQGVLVALRSYRKMGTADKAFTKEIEDYKPDPASHVTDTDLIAANRVRQIVAKVRSMHAVQGTSDNLGNSITKTRWDFMVPVHQYSSFDDPVCFTP